MQKTKHLLPLNRVRAAGKSSTVGDSVSRAPLRRKYALHVCARRCLSSIVVILGSHAESRFPSVSCTEDTVLCMLYFPVYEILWRIINVVWFSNFCIFEIKFYFICSIRIPLPLKMQTGTYRSFFTEHEQKNTKQSNE